MKVRVTLSGPEHTEILVEIIEVNTAALRGRDETEINFIVDQYVQGWFKSKFNLAWVIVDQSSFGLEYKPSEPRDD